MHPSFFRTAFLGIFLLLHSACAPQKSELSTIEPFTQPTALPQPGTSDSSTVTDPICTNELDFIDDVTIEDGMIVEPGAGLDKRWSVRNSGTCDWDPSYRFVRLDADGLVGPAEVDLYPARAGQLAILRVEFTAPSVEGSYQSRWSAVGPDGIPFGVELFVLVEVQASGAEPVDTETPEA